MPDFVLRECMVSRLIGMTGCLAVGLIIGVMPVWAVDVNTATADQLQQIKGIGAKTAERIVAERSRGPFESLEHLSERLSGIGPKTIVKLKAAGLCAGAPQKPCAQPGQPQPVKGVPAKARDHSQLVTPELIELP